LKIRKRGGKMEKMEKLRDMLGAEILLEELLRALSSQELEENVEYIARNNDIEL